MKILMVAPEVYPYAKVGGLADVISGLSNAMYNLGHDVRIICPMYSDVPEEQFQCITKPMVVHLGKEDQECNVVEFQLSGSSASVYLLENDRYYRGRRVYEFERNIDFEPYEPYVFLSRGSIDFCYQFDWIPDVIHCHDWMTSLVPIYIKYNEVGKPLGSVPTVLTIHNLGYQGIFDAKILEYAGISQELFTLNLLEYYGEVNLLKGGIKTANKVTTVSYSYAQEITTPEYGYNLEAILRERQGDLVGIINGIDYAVWNPESDRYLPKNFSKDNLEGKGICKEVLQERANVLVGDQYVIFGVVSRLCEQKGLDVLLEVMSKFLSKNKLAQLILLGTGDEDLVEGYNRLQDVYKGRVSINLGYDEKLSHYIQSGSDYIVMPSRYEPCGLCQLYGMLYGTVPVVNLTGGLKDTVEPFDENINRGTGLGIQKLNKKELYEILEEAYNLYINNKTLYKKIQYQAMSQDFSWNIPTKKYLELYNEIVLKEVMES